MERFFPKDKIILTGNPVRQNLLDSTITKEKALKQLNLSLNKKTILIVGGSLGAQSVNESVLAQLDLIRKNHDIQFIWQTGKLYFDRIKKQLIPLLLFLTSKLRHLLKKWILLMQQQI